MGVYRKCYSICFARICHFLSTHFRDFFHWKGCVFYKKMTKLCSNELLHTVNSEMFFASKERSTNQTVIHWEHRKPLLTRHCSWLKALQHSGGTWTMTVAGVLRPCWRVQQIISHLHLSALTHSCCLRSTGWPPPVMSSLLRENILRYSSIFTV